MSQPSPSPAERAPDQRAPDEEIRFSLRHKLGRDVAWGLAGFFVAAVSGILSNVLIGRHYGADALGVFNQVFALYILASQLAVFGLHYSTLAFVAQHAASHPEEVIERDGLITAAVAATAILGAAVILLGVLADEWIARAFGSAALAVGWRHALVGLWCFALNKVLLAALNGLRHMRAFSICQAARGLLLLGALGVCIARSVPAERLAVILSVAEGSLLVGLAPYSLTVWRPRLPRWEWARRHLWFGLRSFPSGGLVELNSRVDVLVLGLFTSDAVVGIYSMASMLAEGVFQVTVVVRNNMNPLIARHLASGRHDELVALVRRVVSLFTPTMVVIGLVSLACYPTFVRLVLRNEAFLEGLLPFAVLLAGVTLAAGYLPFNMFLVQGGLPGHQTAYTVVVVGTSSILCLALVPFLGMLGAAVAMAVSNLASIVYLKYMVAHHFELRI